MTDNHPISAKPPGPLEPHCSPSTACLEELACLADIERPAAAYAPDEGGLTARALCGGLQALPDQE